MGKAQGEHGGGRGHVGGTYPGLIVQHLERARSGALLDFSAVGECGKV